MPVNLYRRHTEECREKHGWFHTTACQAANGSKRQKRCACPTPDKTYRRCSCPIWFESNENGQQRRWSSKETDWNAAQRRLQECEDAKERGEELRTGKGTTLAEAVGFFLTDKEKGSDPVAPDTLYRHKAVMALFQEFCATKSIVMLRDVKLSTITEWQHTWKLKSPAAKRGRQEKVRNFFRFCVNHEYLVRNPLAAWKSVALPPISHEAVRPFKKGEYEKVLAAVDKTTMTDTNRAKVRACMRLQREAGLSLVDAVTLDREELVQGDGRFRVITQRQKTGTHVNVPISTLLGNELLRIKNGNPRFFFWSGNTLPEDAPSYFQKLYRRVFKAAGMAGRHSSHDFRHTFAVAFMEAGGDIRLLSKALGHSSVTVTEKFYAKFSPKQQELLDREVEKAQAGI